jgi:hypothetical protein
MNARTRNLAIAGGAVVAIGFVGVNTLVAPPTPPAAPESAAAPGSSVIDAGTGGASATPPGAPVDGGIGTTPAITPGAAVSLPSPEAPEDAAAPAAVDRRSYAIGLQDLSGLPPDAAPGAPLELWVTWEPPVTREPRLEKLIGDVVLERTIPGAVPEAPVTVLLSVPADRVGDLIYADGYGRLSVVVPSTRGL